jgi:hypothetical protein
MHVVKFKEYVRNENSILLLVPAILVELLDWSKVGVFHGITGS